MGSAPITSEPMSQRTKITATLATIGLLGAGTGTVMAGLPEGGVVTCTPAELKPQAAMKVADEAPSAKIVDDSQEMTITTNCGTLNVEIFANKAPQSAAALAALAEAGYYNKTQCHNLYTNGMGFLHCGSRSFTGSDTPGFMWGPVENAPDGGFFPAGSVVMLRGQKEDSHAGEMLIAFKDSVLPVQQAGEFTLVGKVTNGLPIIEGVAKAGVVAGSRTPTVKKVLRWENVNVK